MSEHQFNVPAYEKTYVVSGYILLTVGAVTSSVTVAMYFSTWVTVIHEATVLLYQP